MIHGQKKTEKTKTEEQIKEENDLSTKINSKLSEFFQLRNQPILNDKLPALLEFTTILMQLCSDISTIFNYRRELVERLLQNAEDPAGKAAILGGDIKLITKIIQQDPKSYTLWSYRQWLVVKLFELNPQILDKERELCKALLMRDEKNFHVWNYRNWANSIQMDRDQELAFTLEKINSNPFNFSPYHFRTKYLAEKYAQEYSTTDDSSRIQQIIAYTMPKDVFNQEMEMVRTAIYLNPKEEAPWLYYSWLFKQIVPALLLSSKQSQGQWVLLFSLKVSNIQELLNAEEGAPQIITSSRKEFSEIWRASSDNTESISVDSNKTRKTGVMLETGGRNLIGSQVSWEGDVEKRLAQEKKFVLEVLESEDNSCRFAWMQILEIIKSQLYLGVNEEIWSQLTKEAIQIFQHLKEEKKGQKYIEKQKKYWERLHLGNELTEIEGLLRCYRK